jgi:hypothetical protein
MTGGGGVDKSLALPGKEKATANKRYISQSVAVYTAQLVTEHEGNMNITVNNTVNIFHSL